MKFVADIARVSINATIEYNKTTTLTQTWKWKNTTNKTQWAQLGMKGYTFDVYSYDVSSSCSITNQQWAGTGTMPTREYWLRHSSY